MTKQRDGETKPIKKQKKKEKLTYGLEKSKCFQCLWSCSALHAADITFESELSTLDKTGKAIDPASRDSRKNMRTLKLSHSPLCALMGFGKHGEC